MRAFSESKWQRKLHATAWKAINVCEKKKGYLMPEELILYLGQPKYLSHWWDNLLFCELIYELSLKPENFSNYCL